MKDTQKAIEDGVEQIITPQILLSNMAQKNGYEVYVVNEENISEVSKSFKMYRETPHDIISGELIKKELNFEFTEIFVGGGVVVEYFLKQMNDFHILYNRVRRNLRQFITIYNKLMQEEMDNNNRDVRHPFYKKVVSCLEHESEITESFKMGADSKGDISFVIVYNYGNKRKHVELDVPNQLSVARNGNVEKFTRNLFDKALSTIIKKEERDNNKKEVFELEEYKRLKGKFE